MKKKKISNQVMVDSGMKCLSCEETTGLPIPILVDNFISAMKAFGNLHTAKGCNDKKIEL